MKLRNAALLLALAASSSAALAADPNPFNLVNTAGKSIGKASYAITKGKDGYHLVGKFQYHIAGAPVSSEDPVSKTGGNLLNEAQVTTDFKYAEDGNLLTGFTQNATNQILTSFQPDKLRKSVTVNQVQGGVALGSKSIDAPRPDFFLACDYDPGALQLLLTTALAHPHTDSLYFLLVPGNGPRPSTATAYIAFQNTPEDTTGTLDGKTIALKHYVFKYHAGKADLYADADGTLMQADIGPLNASYVRAKFAMAAPAQ